MRFTHKVPMPWFLPGVAPTGRKLTVGFVVVVQFRGDKLACERHLLGSRQRAPPGRAPTLIEERTR